MKCNILDLTPNAACRTILMDAFADEPLKWLSKQMEEHGLKYLLAHADDGVIWGRLDGQELITSHDVAPKYSPLLRTKTLQMARTFSPAGELLVWRNEDSEWAGRLIAEKMLSDATTKWTQAFDERQILLGTKAVVHLDKDFYLMSEGSQGLFHAVPLYPGKIDDQHRTLRLIVRHYLKEDDCGFMRVNASRLVNLLPDPKESNA